MKCSVCHGLDRPTARKETKEKWAGIVKEMQGKKAGWISDAEASKIVDYLAAEYGKK
jgi:mono/diheme cytochrome c family protein